MPSSRLMLALLLDRLLSRGLRAVSVAGVALWILFLPNAPYMVTNFVHLSSDPPVPLWFDVLLFSTYAWTGLVLGFVSIHLGDGARATPPRHTDGMGSHGGAAGGVLGRDLPRTLRGP